MKAFSPDRKTAGLLFLSLTFCYLILAPGSVLGRGYINEELDSGSRMLEIFNTWAKGRTVPPMLWTRHGPIPVILDLPFIKVGKSFVSPDFVLSLQPILLTAGLMTILFLWLRKLCSPRMSLLLVLTAAFGTMLWPYAYIGLETKQSMFVLLAGYLALARGKIRSWPRLLFFALICGLALIVKSTGVVMWPAIAFLMFVQFRDDWRGRVPQLLASSFVILGVVALGVWGWSFYWTSKGGAQNNMVGWMVDSPFQYFSNAIGLWGSPTKGFLVFAPILVVSLCAIPRAFHRHRDITIFALLVTATYAGFMSLFRVTADEVWGSRFMHTSIAPLILCIGAAWHRFEWRKHAVIFPLAIVGLMISFLGAFYYYGDVGWAMEKAGQNTMEWRGGDTVWNEVTFDARLFQVWWSGGSEPVMWVPFHVWVWTPPPGALPWKPINLREYCAPQSLLLQFWHMPRTGIIRTAFGLILFSLIAGPFLMFWTIVRTARHRLHAADQ